MNCTQFSYAKSLFTPVLLLIFTTVLKSQNENLVINPSFETRALNHEVSEIDTIAEFIGWRSPTRHVGQVFGTDNRGFIAENTNLKGQRDFKAKTGLHVASLSPCRERSYLEGELKTPLEVGQKYYVGFWIHYHCISTNGIGISFAIKEDIKDTSYRLHLPLVAFQKQLWDYDAKRFWLRVVDSFIADKPYQNFYIGNFLSRDSTATSGSKTFNHYVAYVDDVFVIQADNKVMQPKKTVAKPTLPIPKVLNRVQFLYNSAEFEPFSYPQLDSAVLTLKQIPTLKILIRGHTSTEGNAAHNQQLSEKRAEAVKNYLVGKGIAAERLQTKGFGSSEPLAAENTEGDKKLNRRIEFEIMKD
jgi:outer membrane protein OmpA-like peptidoglycan-associated protein